jgi:hypothetical protein
MKEGLVTFWRPKAVRLDASDQRRPGIIGMACENVLSHLRALSCQRQRPVAMSHRLRIVLGNVQMTHPGRKVDTHRVVPLLSSAPRV